EELTGAINTYRDAVHFTNDVQLRIQDLPEGLHVVVLDLGGEEMETPRTGEAVLLGRERF
ncbi:MAG TPA: hypothetical protein VH640_31645, partial [Bryobacteraceae bacterium]